MFLLASHSDFLVTQPFLTMLIVTQSQEFVHYCRLQKCWRSTNSPKKVFAREIHSILPTSKSRTRFIYSESHNF
ncbi:hypothetical protein DL96DRAFT_1620394 [Flagelloscypha sp. PMI_526]|nr:hypothetical protein DL96DRAFT_1620394 [Flagelloscypha sp. PMI_526]